MALPSGFQQRLQQMEETRSRRFSLLEAEKELQGKKTQQLAAKISKLRLLELQCLTLEQKNAALDFQILAKKSEVDRIEAEYQIAALQYRELKVELDKLEKQELHRNGLYELNVSKMHVFKEDARKGLIVAREEVLQMRSSISELKSSLSRLQDSDGCKNDPDIIAAEKMKAELLARKQDLDRNLAAKNQIKFILKKQLDQLLCSI